SICLKSVEEIGGLSINYRETLLDLVKAKYNFTLLESMGLDMSPARVHMDMAFSELKNKRYRRATESAKEAKAEVKVIHREYKETMDLYVNAKFAIRDARESGAYVAEAQELMDRAIEALEKSNFIKSRTLLDDVINVAERASEGAGDHIGRADDLEERCRVLFKTLSSSQVNGVDSNRALEIRRDIERAMESGNYQLAESLMDELWAALARLDQAEDREGAEDLEDLVTRKRETAKEAIHRGRAMGADVSDADMHYAIGWQREKSYDLEGARECYSKALDAAIRAGRAMAWKGRY
ncbi:MAG: hypothetical protein JSW25_08550, partial [Thermoplasmata archaeon]